MTGWVAARFGRWAASPRESNERLGPSLLSIIAALGHLSAHHWVMLRKTQPPGRAHVIDSYFRKLGHPVARQREAGEAQQQGSGEGPGGLKGVHEPEHGDDVCAGRSQGNERK